MRTRVVRERASRKTYLEVRLGRHEEIDGERLRVLMDTRCKTLLVPELVEGEAEHKALRFDASGLTTLRDLVRKDVLSHQKYERMLASVAEVAGSCQATGVGLSSLLLESGRVMASFDGVLHFASVPLAHGVPSSRTTMLGLVRFLSDVHRLKFSLEEDEQIARAVTQFHDASDTFDVEAYCQLLGNEFGVVPQTLLRPHIVLNEHVEGPNALAPKVVAPEPEGLKNEVGYLLVRLNSGKKYRLAADETLTLGRSERCSVQLLGNPDISRRQASVLCESEGCTVCDLGSANGTTVRGHDLGENESARVAFGETFQLAGEPFAIVCEAQDGRKLPGNVLPSQRKAAASPLSGR